jgi:hypothetical protein
MNKSRLDLLKVTINEIYEYYGDTEIADMIVDDVIREYALNDPRDRFWFKP